MKNSNKKGFAKQMMSVGVYIALAAAVVGVSTNAVVSILSDDIGNIEVPDSAKDTKYEIRDIEFPEISAFPEFEKENLEAQVSGNQEGVSAETSEKSDAADEKQKADEQEKEPDTHTHEESTPEVSAEEQNAAEEDLGYPGYVAPCEGFVTWEFSPDVLVYSPTMYDYRVHLGTDIACEMATPIKAISGGTITEVSDDILFGKSVTVESPDGLVICYRNLSEALPQGIEEGKTVKTGDVVGGVGQTALAESAQTPHVHIEALRDGELFDVTTLY